MTDTSSDSSSSDLMRRVLQNMSDRIAGRQTQSLLPGDEFLPVTSATPDAPPVAATAKPAAATPATPTSSSSGADVDRFMSAISGEESGGNPTVTNGRTGAHGTYQIMPGNWASWSERAGLPADAPQTPENQQVVARHEMQRLYDDLGSWDAVAVAWYAGESAAQAWLKNPNAARFNAKQGKGDEPSINDYVTTVRGRFGGSQ